MAACGGAPSRPNPSSVSAGASIACRRRCVATPADSATSRRSMSTNRPDSGRFDQSAFAVTWNSTISPGAARRPAVTSGVPSASVAQVWLARSAPGSASTWRVTCTSAGTARPANGEPAGTARGRPACSRTSRRRAGGRRPADAPAAAGPSRRRLFGGARAGEADQQPAFLHPFRSARRVPARRQRRDRPGPARKSRASSVLQVALAQLGEGGEGAPQIIQRADQRRIGASRHRRRAARPAAAASARPAARPTPADGGAPSTSRLSRLRNSGGSEIAALAASARTAGRSIVDARQGPAVAALRQHVACVAQRLRRLRDPHDQPVGLGRAAAAAGARARVAAQIRSPSGVAPARPAKRGEIRAVASARRRYRRRRCRAAASRAAPRRRRRDRAARASGAARPAAARRSGDRHRRRWLRWRRRVSSGAVASSAACRPARSARSSTVSAACMRRGQSPAAAQPLSITSSTGPLPGSRRPASSTGPRQADDHQRSRSQPQQQQPPGRARRRFLGRAAGPAAGGSPGNSRCAAPAG